MNAWKKITLACLSLLILGLAPVGEVLAQVRVSAATPTSAEQGTLALDVVVSGSGFDPTARVEFLVSGTTNPGGIVVRKVVFRNSKEVVATIDVTDTAILDYYDIQVVLDGGRKGKGTTLFSVKAKPNSTSTVIPTYPPARFWHGFTSNGGGTAATSRLYMFGGTSGAPSYTDLGDLWAYSKAGSTDATWTYVLTGSSAPGPRKHVGWSCGGGRCVLANGGSVGLLKETWIFTESSRSWYQLNCSSRRVVCPSARLYPTMAYDPASGVHVLFGGSAGGTATNDTFTFNPGTMAWTSKGSGQVPSPRSRAAATFVPLLGRIALFGGQQEHVRALNDMYFWNGSVWAPIQQVLGGTLTAIPSLHSHSMAWDPVGNHLLVTGGYVDTSDTPNTRTFYVTFANQGGVWTATWALASSIGCQSAAGSVPDVTIHPGTRMAFDSAAGVQVFFGGVENLAGAATGFDNTVECR